ncbi:MAG: YegP family protein [Archangium sp.]|nr:YegP family protein [Archangium sp.]
MTALRTSLLTLALTFTACGPADAFIDGEDGVELMDAESELAATSGRFETFVGKDGQHYFHLLAGNGEKILASQGYATAASAQAGVESVATNATSAGRYLQREASDGSRYFVLTAANGAIIGMSEMYTTAAASAKGALAVQNVVKNIVSSGVALQGDTRFETFKGLSGKYYFHLKANNGQIVLQSQAYTTKAAATNGVTSVKTNGAILARFQVRAAADGQSYFVLKAANGAVIGRSEMYSTASNATAGITAVIGLLATAK